MRDPIINAIMRPLIPTFVGNEDEIAIGCINGCHEASMRTTMLSVASRANISSKNRMKLRKPEGSSGVARFSEVNE